MKRFTRFAMLAGMASMAFGAAHAEPITFNFTFSSAGVSNKSSGQFPDYHGFSAPVIRAQDAATATGSITFERTLLADPGDNEFDLPSPAVLALTVTVANASSGNGTFTAADFAHITFDTNGGTLDFSRQLVGQPTNDDPWGTPSGGDGGDFNFFIPQPPDRPQAPAPVPPNGVFFFTLGADGGNADAMQLTSLAIPGAVAATTTVPTLSSWMLAALAGLLGLATAGFVSRTRKN